MRKKRIRLKQGNRKIQVKVTITERNECVLDEIGNRKETVARMNQQLATMAAATKDTPHNNGQKRQPRHLPSVS